MTASQLIEELSRVAPDTEIYVWSISKGGLWSPAVRVGKDSFGKTSYIELIARPDQDL